MSRAIGLLLLIPMCRAAEPTPEAIRNAAARAVALVQKSQQSWYAKQQCSSCHHQLLPTLAFRDARLHGIPVDEAAAHTDAARTFAPLADIDRAVQYTHQIDTAMDDGLRLVAAEAAGIRPSITTAIYARHIAVRQQPDGYWMTPDARRRPATSSAQRRSPRAPSRRTGASFPTTRNAWRAPGDGSRRRSLRAPKNGRTRSSARSGPSLPPAIGDVSPKNSPPISATTAAGTR